MRASKFIAVFFFFTFCVSSVNAQNSYDGTKISGQIKQIIDKILTDTFINISTTDQAIIEPDANKVINRFIYLSKVSELCELSKHPNPIIRCYAFEGLYYKKYIQLVKVLEERSEDIVLVPTKMGCGTSSDEVIFIMLNLIKSNRVRVGVRMSKNDRDKLIKILQHFFPIIE